MAASIGRFIVGKGENAGYKQFLLSHNVFKRLLFQGHEKSGLCGKGLRAFRTDIAIMIEIVFQMIQNVGGCWGWNASNFCTFFPLFS